MKNHKHISTLPKLVASRLFLHILVGMILITAFNSLLSLYWQPNIDTRYNNDMPNRHFYDNNLPNYSVLDEQDLIRQKTGIIVVNNDLLVVDAKGYDVTVGKQYTEEEFHSLLITDQPHRIIRSVVSTDKQGNISYIIMQQELDKSVFEAMQENTRYYIILSGIGSWIIALLIMVSFVRSVYRPLQKDFRLIRQKVSQMPISGSANDDINIHLVETQSVLDTYAAMAEETEKAHREKASLEEQRHQLISNLSHDLKSPMTTIKGYTELLGQEGITIDEQRHYIGSIYKNVTELNGIVELLSEQVKFQYNDYILHPENKDMNAFLRDICANYYTVFDKEGFRMDFDIMEEPHIMTFDAVHMRRVYANLLENIISHNSKPTAVQIVSGMQCGRYTVQVKDDGIGIAEEYRSHIFDPLFQGDVSRTSHHSGLGLFVVKQILEKHNATIVLTQEPQYKTVFTITFE